ncbi:MAG TPA: hypothetical protein VKP61_14665 [Candidatus Acidoferrum sp.]|nr:hypothetical protein [Candidatus Acidoferrum sp.]
MQKAKMTGVEVGGKSDGLVRMKWEWILRGEPLRFHRHRIASTNPDCGGTEVLCSGDFA